VRFVQKFLNELAFFVLTGGFAGKEEREAARALGVRLSLDEVLGDIESRFAQAHVEAGDFANRGDAEHAACLQGIARGAEPATIFKEDFSFFERARIGLEKDGVDAATLAGEGGGGEIMNNVDTAIEQGVVVFEKRFLPGDEFADGLENGKIALFLRKCCADRLGEATEAESHDPDFRLACGAKGMGAELGEFIFGEAHGCASELLAVAVQVKAFVVLMEFEGAAIRQGGMSENDSWFHVFSGCRSGKSLVVRSRYVY
jgi:hypothetical protein